MFEKVNPAHPDKLADRIAGAIVDLAYKQEKSPRIAVECMLGHGMCFVMIESGTDVPTEQIKKAARRITGNGSLVVQVYKMQQDEHLAENQREILRCGDNGIFKGMPVTLEEKKLAGIAREIYRTHPTDGKYILDGGKLVICQSRADTKQLKKEYPGAIVNPLGEWTGGPDVDTCAVNRKLGSDMGDAVTGGGLHGKDLSKADVSVTIYAHIKAQQKGEPVEFSCAIGDEFVDGLPFEEIVRQAKVYVDAIGGFEKLAEWGLIR